MDSQTLSLLQTIIEPEAAESNLISKGKAVLTESIYSALSSGRLNNEKECVLQ